MAKSKVSSFVVAILVAVVSFFVIFLFFPGTSEKLFGVSIKNGEVDIEQVSQTVKEKVETVTDSAADRLSGEIQKLISSEN